MDTAVAEAPPAQSAHADIEAQLITLMEGYRRVLAEAAKLPMFSLWPSLILMGHYLLVYPGFVIDLVLIPYNLAVWIARAAFKRNWRYIAPATKRIKYAALYFWRGEASFGAVLMRPAVRWLVRGHVANRLPKLAELIYLADVDDETRFRLIDWLERERKIWAVQDLTQVSLKGTIPTLAVAAGTFLWSQIEATTTKDLLHLYAMIFAVVLGYFVVTLFLGSFPTKRGLFLGRPAKRAWAPGGVSGAGLYALEDQVFAALGAKSRETPVDGLGTLWLSLTSLGLLGLSYAPELSRLFGAQISQFALFYRDAVSYGQDPTVVFASQLGSAAMAVVIFSVALLRRSILKRS